MLYLLPYKMGSDSAKAIAQRLNILRITGYKRLGRRDTVINWGNKEVVPFSRWGEVRTLNTKDSVAVASNKIETFIELTKAGICTVPWTVHPNYARTWLDNEGGTVVARNYVSASQGRGITIVTGDDVHFPNSPLYTSHVSKCHEYRVHVAFGKVIDYSKKRRRNDVEVNEYVRNYENGWVFCRENTILPAKVKDIALKSTQVVGLDFGALDILYRERDDKAYILEINTAPGIEGTTLDKYVETFKEVMNAETYYR